MKRKHLFLAIAALLAAGGLWFARSGRGAEHSAPAKTSTAKFQTLDGQPEPGRMSNPPARRLEPPNQSRRFREFTPEQRVQQARKGHGPGG